MFEQGKKALRTPDARDVLVTLTGKSSVKSTISARFPKIGRIDLPLNLLIPYGGTGFVVGDGLLMTNRHVAQLFSGGLRMSIK